LILSSCSPYFEEILSGISPFQHPVLFMRDIPFWILKSLCDFMYAGEVHIFQNKLEELLTVAEALKIKGLAGKSTPPENQEEQQQKTDSTSNSKEVKKKQQQQQQDKAQHPPPLKKNPVYTNNYESTSQDYDNDDLLDPLDLLEPLYEEAAEEKKPSSTMVKPKEIKYQYQPIKKPFTRKLRKRKYSEQRDPSPPPVFSFRKGTRSRPNVKIPKYYHSDYSNLPKPTQNSQTDPLLDVEEIKTEPIDVEDNLIDYSDEENQYMENSIDPTNCDSPIIITSAKPPLPVQDKFKKIKLSKPIITEVHTIEETKTTAGGLEVIKITVQQPEEADKGKEEAEGPDPLQAATVTENDAVNGTTASTTITRITVGSEGAPADALPAETADEETEINVPGVEGGLDNPPAEATNNRIEEEEKAPEEVAEDIHIEDVRTACADEVDQQTEEERRTTSLDHLEKEAMNVANAIYKENQAGPPDVE
ncbi:myoneurin-like, partial [Asbolus verrucosus]